MEIISNYGGGQSTGSVKADAAVERQGRAERAAGKLNGEQLKGSIVEISRNETPQSVTVKLPGGELLKAAVEPALPPDVKVGDYVKFTAASGEGRDILLGMERIEPRAEAEQRLALMKSALEVAGLKPSPENLKLVSVLLENEMPINKEAVLTLSRFMKMAGAENVDKAVLLMKNDIAPTLSALEKLDGYINGGGKLIAQIETLAKNIMEMDAGPEKQRLMQVLSNISQNFAETGEASARQAAAQGGMPASGETGESQAGAPAQQAAQTVQAEQGDTQTPKTAATEQAAQQPQPQPAEIETGTRFFREIFGDRQSVEKHLTQNPLSPAAERFIDENLDNLKNGLAEMSRTGEVTKESALKLIKSAAELGVKIPVDTENPAEMKSFILRLAEKSGLLNENIEKAERFNNVIAKGAKKIAERLSVSLDSDREAEKLDKAFENIKERLSLAAKELGDSGDSSKIKQNIEDIKDNLKFLGGLKNTPFMEFPIFMEGNQKHADLYVFSRKGGQKRSGHSQSALLSLDLANLGHFETYIQKTDRSVSCQFRIESGDTEGLVKENVERLSAALREKGYSLDAVSYRKTDEKFTLLDEEPEADGRNEAVKLKGGSFTIDYRT